MAGYEGKRVIETKGRWALEQLGPIDVCLLEAELASTLGETLRAGLRLVVAYLAEPATDEEAEAQGPWAKLDRIMKALNEDPRQLLGRIMDRDILADAAQISATLVDMIRAVSVREIRSIAERLLVRLPGRNKGGLFVSIAPGQPPTVPISSLADIDAHLADNPHEFWRLLLWGLELNLRPLIAALGTGRGRGEDQEAPASTPSSAPTQRPPGASTR